MSKCLNDMSVVPKVPKVPKVPDLRDYIEYRINNRVIRYSIPHYQQSRQSIHRQSIHRQSIHRQSIDRQSIDRQSIDRQLSIPLQYIQYYPQQYHTTISNNINRYLSIPSNINRYQATRTVSYKGKTLSLQKNKKII